MPSSGDHRPSVVSAETRLAYDDLADAVRFLTDVFGLTERIGDRLPDDAGGFSATWFELGDVTLMAGRSGDHGLVSPKGAGATAMIMATVADIGAHYRRAAAAGAEIVTPIHDVPWGFRRYEALDCEGHRWHFMQRLA